MPNQFRKPLSKAPATEDSIQRKVTLAELENLKEKIGTLVQKQPDKAATILTLWLKQGVQTLKRTKAG